MKKLLAMVLVLAVLSVTCCASALTYYVESFNLSFDIPDTFEDGWTEEYASYGQIAHFET